MATQYDPILKDSTGQAIVTKLEGIKNAINPTAENIPITPITDMEAENVQEGLEELKGTLTNTSASSTTAGITVKKEANIVMVTFGNLTLATGETKALAQQIPVGYRPSDNITLFGKVYNGSAYVDCRILIRNTGIVTIDALTGAAISGLQPQYIYPKDVTYIIN